MGGGGKGREEMYPLDAPVMSARRPERLLSAIVCVVLVPFGLYSK